MKKLNTNSELNLTTVKFVAKNGLNTESFKDLICKKITEYDCIYLRRKLISKVEHRSAIVNNNIIISHSNLDIIKDVARELRDIYKIDFNLKLIK